MILPPLMYVTHRRLMGDGIEIVDTLREAVWSLPPQSIMVYVREPDLEGLAMVELCKAFVAVVRDASQRIVVRDRVDVAKHVGADGVHLPEKSFPPADVRGLWPEALIGRSVHSVDQLLELEGVDYATLSPIFETDSKPGHEALGVDVIAAAKAVARVPMYALGGINADNATKAFAAGADGVAMMRDAWRPFTKNRGL